jgi:sugar phosphate permease
MTTGTFGRAMLLPWLICGLGAVFYCYEFFLRITPGVITPELMRAYDLTGSQVGNLSAFYYHAYVPMQIIVGLFMDRFGPRRLLTIACLLCAAGTYLFAGNLGLGWAQAGRFLVGFGSAFAFVGALKLATIWLPPNRFALISGIITCLGMLGAMMGDILLRQAINVLGWHHTIYISAGIGVVLAAILWLVIRDSSPDHPDHHLHVMDFKGLFAGLLLALRNPHIWLAAFIGFLLYLSLSAFAELWGIDYLEQAHGFSKDSAAYANSMIFLGWAIGSPLWGLLSDFMGKRILPVTLGSLGALIFVMILLYMPGLSVGAVYLVLFCFGILSSAQILVFAISHEASKMKMAGTAIAMTNMIVMIGGNVFQPVIGKLLDHGWTGVLANGARIYPVHAYQVALSVMPIDILLAFIVSLFMREINPALKAKPGLLAKTH